MAKTKATTTNTPHDSKGEKKYPNGIKVLAQAIWQYWPIVLGQSNKHVLTIDEFARLADIDSIGARYKANYTGDAPAVKRAHKKFNDIGTANCKLAYYHIRYMAEYLNIPAGAVLLFAQLISVERRAKGDEILKRENMLKLVGRLERFCAESRKIIEEKSQDDEGENDYFLRRYDVQKEGLVEEEYLADLVSLKRIVDRMNSEHSS